MWRLDFRSNFFFAHCWSIHSSRMPWKNQRPDKLLQRSARLAVAVAELGPLGILCTMRFSAIFFALAAAILCQGCVAFPYPTPGVKGSVIDANTKQPIADARIEVHHYSCIHCISAADGSFDLPGGSAWRPCFLMPGDVFVASANVSFKAHGYKTVTKRYSTLASDFRPVVLEQPIELEKETRP